MTHTNTDALSDERLNEILAGLEGVTPGPWISIHHTGPGSEIRQADTDPTNKHHWPFRIAENIAGQTASVDRPNFDHIARCDPDTIRYLVTQELSRRSASNTGGVEVKARHELVERLGAIFRSDDHERGCQGREYSCSCGYDARIQSLAEEAAAALTSLIAERDGAIAERDKAQDIGIKSIKRAQDAYRQSVASARHLANIIRAYDENSGHEPSVSVLARAIDEARTALSLDTNKGEGV